MLTGMCAPLIIEGLKVYERETRNENSSRQRAPFLFLAAPSFVTKKYTHMNIFHLAYVKTKKYFFNKCVGNSTLGFSHAATSSEPFGGALSWLAFGTDARRVSTERALMPARVQNNAPHPYLSAM